MTLEENPSYRGVEARNSDIALTILIWQRWYNVSDKSDGVIHLHRLFDLPREDNIKRIRAIIQNVEHKFYPTKWEIAKKRNIERERWEQGLGYRQTPDEIATHYQTVKDTTPPPIEMPAIEQAQLFNLPAKRRSYEAIG